MATTNMYGCTPCPQCKSEYRWPTQQRTVVCDECGFVEPIAPAKEASDASAASEQE
jgi:uncharacterized Zn ribbon protein